MSRYVPARHYISFGIVALALAGFSGWLGLQWTPAFCPALLFFLTGAMLIGLALRPAIKVFDSHIEIGKRIIPWHDIRRVDRTGWISRCSKNWRPSISRRSIWPARSTGW